MKLIIQIPSYNEMETIGSTVQNLPKKIEHIDEVEYLIIDDGSTDDTVAVAKKIGVHHVLKLGSNKGLANAFSQGIEYATQHGADIVVNIDADNQYSGKDITKLIRPILDNKADMVVGCRPLLKHPEFGWIKKMML